MSEECKNIGNFQLPPDATQPVYLRLRQCILGLMTSGKLREGDMLPSRNQLSHALGISATPYHKAMDGLIRDGYLTARHGKGVFVRSVSPRLATARMVTLLTAEPEILEHLAFTLVINGLLDELVPANYSLKFTFFTRGGKASEIRRKLDGLHSEGVIVPFCSSNTAEQLFPLREAGVPLIFLGRGFPEIGGCTVETDSFHAIDEYVKTFAEKCLSAVYLGQPVEFFAGRHIHWLEEACTANKVRFQLVKRIPCTFDQDAGRLAMEQFLSSGAHADLVIAEDDYVACGALSSMEQRGIRLPLTVIGGFLKHLYPLSDHPVLDLGHRRMGRMAAKALLDAIAGKQLQKKIVVHSEYIK